MIKRKKNERKRKDYGLMKNMSCQAWALAQPNPVRLSEHTHTHTHNLLQR
jgi:hypothetical protein